jgi:hypothetical protein
MVMEERIEVLTALVEGNPVYVQQHDGTETEVCSLEMKGTEAVGWRAKVDGTLIPVSQVTSISLEALKS